MIGPFWSACTGSDQDTSAVRLPVAVQMTFSGGPDGAALIIVITNQILALTINYIVYYNQYQQYLSLQTQMFSVLLQFLWTLRLWMCKMCPLEDLRPNSPVYLSRRQSQADRTDDSPIHRKVWLHFELWEGTTSDKLPLNWPQLMSSCMVEFQELTSKDRLMSLLSP